MGEILEFLGFVSLKSSIWNSIGYIAFIGIIIGVLCEKYRKPLLFFGPFLLIFYAIIFLKDPIFISLQILIALSGGLQFFGVPQRSSTMTLASLTILAYIFLIFNGSLISFWPIVGSLGLLGMVFGIVRLPKIDAFLIMATGGVLLVAYAFIEEVWVYVLLNIFFAISNIKIWYKSKSGA